MREITAASISDAIADLCMNANLDLQPDVTAALQRARSAEASPSGRSILEELLENAAIARADHMPLCQDTGTAVLFLEVGQDLQITGGGLEEAVSRGVSRAYTGGYLRRSMVTEPLFERKNSGDNTPAIIHTRIVPGERLHIRMAAKGGGAENMSRLAMLTPADGLGGVRRFILETVEAAGPNACPPVIVGVGVGGNFEHCAYLAKWALFRPVGRAHPDPRVAALEQELLVEINRLGIGPQGLGGTVTALAVQIEVAGCHIAALPVAVNIECHSHRHQEAVL